jgi:hypothetical protein
MSPIKQSEEAPVKVINVFEEQYRGSPARTLGIGIQLYISYSHRHWSKLACCGTK